MSARKPETFWGVVWRRFRKHRLAVAAAILLAFLLVVCLGVSIVVPADESLAMDFGNKLQPPSAEHPFGTNKNGQDYFVRCLYGGQISLRVGVEAMLVALLVGTTLGSLAGWLGGWVDNVIMRLVDVMLAVPIFFVLLLLAKFYGTNLHVVVGIIGLTSWTDICRLVRADFLSLREKEFVESARAIGVPGPLLVLRHLLPNAASPLIVAATLGMARAVVTESALSYLGFGVQPPIVSWGSLLRIAQTVLTQQPWLAFFPGLLIFLTVLSFNFLGDGLRDAMDPRALRR